ncbi:RusA family crossover junction endodeoxyribonuclease [Glutamicibacter arilaitensis]|uniref:RusA family crossover junction endodeoxyribonuclease n=1 Tax=Glutamicibacter arilaitensis TaxID=256701 RepID=A0A2N7S683_9MICC|nr:RusA family crossover junction endodeoxyribonuclease [Glutamicibacter arilaitensis]PMQ21645.1 RusA family crossover junction endodeoxyribonuclease [Glutamicibacter arilaitensis]
MSDQLEFFAEGLPVSQGSKRIGRNRATGQPVLVEDNVALKPWRSYVTMRARRAAAAAKFFKLEGAVEVSLIFTFERPRGHYGTGRNRAVLKASAPEHMMVKPDVDKLTRAILDSLTDAKAYGDDSRVVSLRVQKRYVEPNEQAGAHVFVIAAGGPDE